MCRKQMFAICFGFRLFILSCLFFFSSISLDPRYSSTSIGLYSFFSLYFNVVIFNQNNQQIELKQNQNKIHRYTERKVSQTG